MKMRLKAALFWQEFLCLSNVNDAVLMLISSNLHKNKGKVSIKTRSSPASFSLKGQVTKQTAVERSLPNLFETKHRAPTPTETPFSNCLFTSWSKSDICLLFFNTYCYKYCFQFQSFEYESDQTFFWEYRKLYNYLIKIKWRKLVILA